MTNQPPHFHSSLCSPIQYSPLGTAELLMRFSSSPSEVEKAKSFSVKLHAYLCRYHVVCVELWVIILHPWPLQAKKIELVREIVKV